MYHVTDNVRGSVLLADGSPHFDCPANGLTMEPSSIHFFDRYSAPAVRVWHPQAGDGPADHHVSNAKRSGRVQHVLRRNRQADTAAAANQQLAVYGHELGSDKARSPHPLPVALRLSLDFLFGLVCIYLEQNLPSLCFHVFLSW